MAAEKTYENKIKGLIKAKGGWYVKFFANRMTRSGVPDLLACIKSNFIAIEVKAKYGKPTDLQLHQRDLIRKAGGIAVICYPDQFKLLETMIDSILDDDAFTARRLQFDFDKEET